MYPSQGTGRQSKYYDEDLLYNGTYDIISVTLSETATDATNAAGSSILRAGLLLVPDPDNDGYYTALNTDDGYLNGDTPTQYIHHMVVLGRKVQITKTFILGNKRERTIAAAERVVPAYFQCNIRSTRVYYNNSTSVSITDAQWDMCQRISVIPSGIALPSASDDSYVRALLWKRIETFVNPADL
jgi:hypothetical protein